MESLTGRIGKYMEYKKHTKFSLRNPFVNVLARIKYKQELKKENEYSITVSHSILVDIICDWSCVRDPIRNFSSFLKKYLDMEGPIYLEYLGNWCNRFQILCKDKNGKETKISLFAKCENAGFPYLAIYKGEKEVYYSYMPNIGEMYENNIFAEYSKNIRYE